MMDDWQESRYGIEIGAFGKNQGDTDGEAVINPALKRATCGCMFKDSVSSLCADEDTVDGNDRQYCCSCMCTTNGPQLQKYVQNISVTQGGFKPENARRPAQGSHIKVQIIIIKSVIYDIVCVWSSY